MPVNPSGASSENADLQQTVYGLYTALTAASPLDPETGLGGKLLFAGELSSARHLLYAANIAGGASLAASIDPMAQRQAMRDGVVDFLVTSLDEALRILKNEIRKRQTVSVSVGLEPAEAVRQMLERGVLPDLLPPGSWSEVRTGLSEASMQALRDQGAQQVNEQDTRDDSAREVYATWSVDRDAALWLPRIDARVIEMLPDGDVLRHRWLKLAPRYLGRVAQKQHGVGLSVVESEALREAVAALLAGQDNLPEVYLAGEPLR
jgi:hypothetical protein